MIQKILITFLISFDVSATSLCAPKFKLVGDFCVRTNPYTVYFARLKANTNCATKRNEHSLNNYYCIKQ